MGSHSHDLDAHEQPSAELRAEWKSVVKLTPKELGDYRDIDDPRSPSSDDGFKYADPITKSQLRTAIAALRPELADLATQDSPVVYHTLLPGE